MVWILLLVVVAVVAIHVVRGFPESNCNQNCNQGRTCDCKDK